MAAPRQVRKANWGGARPGAGRKPGPDPNTPHRARPTLRATTPVHVTLRARLTQLRTPDFLLPLCAALRGSNERDPERFRIVHFAVQRTHVELIVEAKSERYLSEGMRSVTIRVARYVNDHLSRSGSLWADRWRGRTLKTPRDVRAALVSVLAGFRAPGNPPRPAGIDPYSSGAWFDGWRGWAPDSGVAPPFAERAPARAPGARAELPPVAAPRSAVLREGWRSFGLLDLGERPTEVSRAATSSAEASSPP
jgi:REP-associated tyrosine transposase